MDTFLSQIHRVSAPRHLAVLALGILLVGCGGGSSPGTDTGGGSSACGANSQSSDVSDCVGLTNLGQTMKNGQPVEGNNDFRLFNTAPFAVNARLYSAGYVGTTVSRLAAGASSVDDFFISLGPPSVFACRAPLTPSVSAGGTNKRCQ